MSAPEDLMFGGPGGDDGTREWPCGYCDAEAGQPCVEDGRPVHVFGIPAIHGTRHRGGKAPEQEAHGVPQSTNGKQGEY